MPTKFDAEAFFFSGRRTDTLRLAHEYWNYPLPLTKA